MFVVRIAASFLVAGAVAIPAVAQRGGHGSHGGSASHSAYSVPRNPPMYPAPSLRLTPPMYSVPSIHSGPVRSSHRGSVRSSNRGPGHFERRREFDRSHLRTAVPVYGIGLAYAPYLPPECNGFVDCGESESYAAPQPAAAPAPAEQSSEELYADPPQRAETAPAVMYRQPYQRPVAQAPEPEPASAVTIIFKDGNSQQIHNYMLTRTTLYVQDEHRREIPVEELDLPATQRVNRDAGVAFQLPG